MAKRTPTAESIVEAIAAARDSRELRIAAEQASLFLRSRLSEAAYAGECHHCDEAGNGEPCSWCGLVLAQTAKAGAHD